MKWVALAAILLQAATPQVPVLPSPPSNLQVLTVKRFCVSSSRFAPCYFVAYGELGPWRDPKVIKPEYDETVINGKVWGWYFQGWDVQP